jgi:SAM-dependent methyltransferase
MPSSVATDPNARERLSKDYWEHVWQGAKLPRTVRPGAVPDEHAIFQRLLPPAGSETTLLEAGCAPGRWLHYFADNFGYTVTGLDYADNACRMTRRNLQLLDTPATIVNADLFSFDPGEKLFDVVVSLGLIEHFVDLGGVVKNLIGLAKPNGGLVVSLVPNLYGPEGWVLKRIRPKVYAGHVPIKLPQFRELHEQAGTETLFSNYVGGCSCPPPLRGTQFARNHTRLSLVLNLPVIGFNRLARYAEVAVRRFPRSRYLCPKLLYIGRRIG